MAYPMRGEKRHRQVQCVVNMCRNRDTILFYRGRDFGREPMHLCRDCIRDILAEYIRLDGKEAAWELLGGVVGEIIPAAEPEEAEETAEEPDESADKPKRGRRKADAE